ncbi:LysR family transcriptional regulator [Microbulbifer elongatus]|uniref:LysR family transcriptional regulator n=1 Tax=Microbulbifer elongatus TaxID=86173 RepID=UPI001E47885F|nr:LysR family transcriptional regulator [Microbulbifer elongatus]
MNTEDLQLFVHTAEIGSITGAARYMEMTAASASAALKRLEKQLQTQLFIRSTRRLRITDEGERFLVYCRQALAVLEEGRASIDNRGGTIAGELRLSAPSDLGRNILLGWLDEMMDQHPGLNISLTLGDSLSDFYLDRVDLAIRYGNLADSSRIAFKLATTERVLCASPDYIARNGAPESPQALLQHNCLLFQLSGRINDIWEFSPPEGPDKKTEKIRVTSNRTTNDADVVRRWTVEGKGISFKARLDMSNELRSGRLIRVLPQLQSPPIDLNLVCPSRRQVTPAVLLLRDFLREKLAQQLA